MSRTETILPPPESLSLDAIDGLGMIYAVPGSNSGPGVIFRRGNANLQLQNFYQLNGATIQNNAAGTAHVRRYGPGANQVHSIMTPFAFTVGVNRALTPAALRVARLFVYETVFQIETALAGVQRFIGLLDDNLQVDSANGGIGIRSLSTENGGAWTLKYRLTNGGALQTGVNTGIVPDGLPHAFQVTYRDSTSPLLRINIDGVNVASIAGAANLPAADGNECLYPCTAVGSTTNPGLGEVAYTFDSRFYIQELEPMPQAV
jgi:hypothetical protein